MSCTRLFSLMMILGLGLAMVVGCSDDNPGEPQGGTPNLLVAPLDNAVVDVQLTANQPTTINFTLQLPPDIPLVTAAEIDIAATLDHVRIDNISLWNLIGRKVGRLLGKAEDIGATATLRVDSNAETVCETGVLYGPFEISHVTALVVSPETVAADEATLQIINMGSMTVCLTILPNFDGLLSVDAVAMQISEGNCESPANFAGTWNGTFECGNNCLQPWSGDIQLVVTQSGTQASYTDDGGDSFSGVVCGNMFRFEYTGEDFVERGTLTLDGPNSATKRSTWRSSTPPYCGGNCVDYLTRDGNGDCPLLVITSEAPPNGQIGQPYFFQATTSGGQGTVTRWAIPVDFIPGLEYQENGILSGTPTAEALGTWYIQVTAYDMCDPESQTVGQLYSITIGE